MAFEWLHNNIKFVMHNRSYSNKMRAEVNKNIATMYIIVVKYMSNFKMMSY